MPSAAAQSLGVSDPLTQMTLDADEEKRKKKLQEQMQRQLAGTDMGPATMALFGK